MISKSKLRIYLSGSQVSSVFLALAVGTFLGMAFDFVAVVVGVVVEGGLVGGEGLLPAAGVEEVEARLMASVAGKRRRRANRRTKRRRREETELRLGRAFLGSGNGGRPPCLGPP